jgi:curli production assembly/transport component CsgE
MHCNALLPFAIALGALPAFGQAPAAGPATYTRQGDPYAGLVADSTVTFIGQDFYRAFMSSWREMAMTERYSLSVFERPSARWGSMVWIEFGHRRVFSTVLSPGRRDAIAQSGREAAGIAYQNVVDADVQRLLFKDPDLAPDEF